MSEMRETVAKARLLDLQGEIERQTKRVREASDAARSKAAAWLEWRGDGFDIFNLEQGCGKVREAVDDLSREIARLQRLASETNELKEDI